MSSMDLKKLIRETRCYMLAEIRKNLLIFLISDLVNLISDYVAHPNICRCLHIACCLNQVGITVVQGNGTEIASTPSLNTYSDFVSILDYCNYKKIKILPLYNRNNPESKHKEEINYLVHMSGDNIFWQKLTDVKIIYSIQGFSLTKRGLRKYLTEKITQELGCYILCDGVIKIILEYLFHQYKCRCGNIYCKSKYITKITYIDQEYEEIGDKIPVQVNPMLIFDLNFLKSTANEYGLRYGYNYYLHIRDIIGRKITKVKQILKKNNAQDKNVKLLTE